MATNTSKKKRNREEDEDEEGSSQPSRKQHLHGPPLTERPKHRDGSILRITMTNFMTYNHAWLDPGPRLNLMFGPNGTGKSSVVSAVCLGFGFPPKLTGRASYPKDFIQTGKDEAIIEIIVQSRPKNRKVRRTIRRDGQHGSSFFHIDGKRSTLDDVLKLCNSLNIKLENLTQFLPQDRVREFSKLNPQQLLQQTSQAILEPATAALYPKLLEKSKAQSNFLSNTDQNKKKLAQLRQLNETLLADVQRYQQRRELEQQAAKFRMAVPALTFAQGQAEGREVRDQVEVATKKIQEFQETLLPFKQIEAAAKRAFKTAETHMANTNRELDGIKREFDKLKSVLSSAEHEGSGFKEELIQLEERKKTHERKIQEIKNKLTKLEGELAQLSNPDEAKQTLTLIRKEIAVLEQQLGDCTDDVMDIRSELDTAKSEHQWHCTAIQRFHEHKTARMRYINDRKPAAIRAWRWCEANKEKLQGSFYLVALEIVIKTKNPLHAKFIENAISRDQLFSIIVENKHDHDIIQKCPEQGIMIVNRPVTASDRGEPRRPCDDRDLMKRLGVTCWLDETIDVPLSVMCALREFSRIEVMGCTDKKINPQTYDKIVQATGGGNMVRLYTPDLMYNIQKSRYAREVKTRSSELRAAELLDIHDDSTATEYETKKAELEQTMKQLEEKRKTLAKTEGELRKKREAKQQMAYKHQQHIQQHSKLKAVMESKRRELANQRELDITKEREKIVKRMRVLTAKRAETIMKMVAVQQGNLEKKKDAFKEQIQVSLKDKAQQTATQTLQDKQREGEEMKQETVTLEQKLNEIKRGLHRLKAARLKAIKEYMEEYGEDAEDNIDALIKELTKDSNVSELEAKVAALQTEAEGIHTDETVIHEYEKRKKEIKELEQSTQDETRRLDNLVKQIDDMKNKWWGEITEKIDDVSARFQAFCEFQGIQGKVSAEEAAYDFEKYRIDLHVKFREEEQLTQLNSMRQSGGERAVTTVLYLLALQSRTSCPFRIVDEIDQGMDIHNQKKIFQKMLASSAEPDAPQSFLITPKLIPGQIPDRTTLPHLDVFCVWNGQENCPQETIQKTNTQDGQTFCASQQQGSSQPLSQQTGSRPNQQEEEYDSDEEEILF